MSVMTGSLRHYSEAAQMTFKAGHLVRRPEGWSHTREAKDRIASAMVARRAREAAARANLQHWHVRTQRAVHIMREGKRNPICGMKLPAALERTMDAPTCRRCMTYNSYALLRHSPIC